MLSVIEGDFVYLRFNIVFNPRSYPGGFSFSVHTDPPTAELLHKDKDKQAEGQSAQKESITLPDAGLTITLDPMTHCAATILFTTYTSIIDTVNNTVLGAKM